MLLPNVLNPQIPRPLSFSSTTPFKLPFLQPLKSPAQFHCYSSSSSSSSSSSNNSLSAHHNYDFEQEHVVGDCIVFEDGIFEDPYLQTEANRKAIAPNKPSSNKLNEIEPENLVPDQWKEVQAELNISKKQRRKIAQEIEFGRKVEKRKQGYMPLRDVPLDEYKAFREAKLKELSPVALDNPTSFPMKVDGAEKKEYPSERVAPKDPRWAVYGKGLDDVRDFFNSGNYEPGQMNSQGRRKLFTKEEKVLLNRKIPNLSVATSDKWLPVHTLAASGEFYLLDALLKHADINCVDKDGLGALHKAIIGKKHAITNYLLRESANPFARDKDGASLLHYAVQTGSGQAVKILLLYNVDINLQDNDGWTPLHVAVQTRRTDMVQLLLIKGADKTIKNRDGLSPLDLCLYWGRDIRTYELIKLLKLLPKSR